MADNLQVKFGKAFEYACVDALFRKYSTEQEVIIEASDAMNTAEKYFKQNISGIQPNLVKASDAAIRIIDKFEPNLAHPENNGPLYISIQTDAEGKKGDVRDVLCKRAQSGWTIGFSCKHNSDAIKHSRLSDNNDFGKNWLGITCSTQYFIDIKPVFDRIKSLRAEGRAAGKEFMWHDLEDGDKFKSYYKPILHAFVAELQRINNAHPDTPKRLGRFLIGTNDYYKITANGKTHSTSIDIIKFARSKTLCQKAGGVSPITMPTALNLPSKFYDIEFKSDSTINVICNNGWAFSMRLHNGDGEIDPTLKFDVKFINCPYKLISLLEPWDNN